MLELREGECQDLSLNGMFIHTAKPSPRGALIRFECDAGRPEDNFRGTGRVVWQRRKPDSRGPAGMGVRFVRLESGDHDALERIIRQLNDNAPANPGSAAQRAHLGATIRGMPPGQAEPDSDRPAAPASVRAPAPAPRAESGAAPKPSSARPPMPTLLEVPRGLPGERQQPGLMATLPETGSHPPSGGPMNRTLLGQPSPSLNPRAESGRPGEQAGDGAGAGGGGSATVIESALRPEQIAAARAAAAGEAPGEPETGRGGRGSSKKRTRQDRPQRGHDGARNGRGETGATQPDPGGQVYGGSGRPRGRTDGLELSDPMADFGARRRRLAYDDDGDGRAESEAPRKNPGTVMWLVLGTGLIVSWGLVTLFGTVPIGVPDKYEVAASKPVPGPGEPAATPPTPGEGAAPATASGSPAPAATPPARRYALFVDTHPPGARISVAGQSVVAPARVEFDAIQPPLKLVAELASYKTTTVDVWPSDFTGNGARLEHRIVLDLQPESTAPETPAAVPAAEAAGRPPRPAVAAAPKPRKTEPPAPAPEPAAAGVAAAAAAGDAPPSDEPAPAGEPQAPAPAPSASGSGQALAQALDCLGRGDNRCVIRALENRANSARELELLIETYRAMSSTPKAESEMRRYLSIYPNGKRSAEYRRLLERRGAKL
jgi:hypothetical protein